MVKQIDELTVNELTEVMKETKDFDKPKIPEGFYPCKCVGVKPIKDGEFGPRIVILCHVLETGDELGHVCYKKLTSNSRATQAVLAFGIEFKDGKQFHFKDLIGKSAQAVIEDYVDKVGETVSSITKFKVLKKK